MEKSEIEILLTKVFDVMDKEFLDSYIVMNKYDEVPYKLPSDLDMSITIRDFKRLDQIISKISQVTGLLITQKIWHGYQKCAYILSPLKTLERFRMQLDFFTDFSVKNTPLLIPSQEIQSNTRRYGRFAIPNYNVEYVFLLMRRIFKNDFDEEHCNIIKEILLHDTDEIEKYSEQYLGAELGTEISQYLLNNNIRDLQKRRNVYWQTLRKFSSKQTSFSFSLKFKFNEIRRYLFRMKYPVGMSIALLSPDGGGKSSVYEKLLESCWGSFHGINRMYFRPRLLKNLGSLKPINPTSEAEVNPNPHGKKPNGLIKSFIRFFYYNIDFIFGYLMLVKKMRIQKQLVIFDRYYYDYFVDIQRYQYSFSKWVPRLFAWTIPTPDVIFILDGEAETLYARKKELPIEELKRQIVAYRKIADRYKNASFVNVEKPLNDVVLDVTSRIFLHKAKRTAKSMGIKLDENGIPM